LKTGVPLFTWYPGLVREVPVNRMKEFEEHFLLEMETKLPDCAC
jgi:hypothetical protein